MSSSTSLLHPCKPIFTQTKMGSPAFYHSDEKTPLEEFTFPDLSELTWVKSLHGGANTVHLCETKEKSFVVKQNTSDEHIKAETYSLTLYARLGFAVPRFAVYRVPPELRKTLRLRETSENLVLVSEFIDGLNDVSYEEIPSHFSKGLMLDVFQYNWDAMRPNNIIIRQKIAFRVDAGCTLLVGPTGHNIDVKNLHQINYFEHLTESKEAASYCDLTLPQIEEQKKHLLSHAKLILDSFLELHTLFRFPHASQTYQLIRDRLKSVSTVPFLDAPPLDQKSIPATLPADSERIKFLESEAARIAAEKAALIEKKDAQGLLIHLKENPFPLSSIPKAEWDILADPFFETLDNLYLLIQAVPLDDRMKFIESHEERFIELVKDNPQCVQRIFHCLYISSDFNKDKYRYLALFKKNFSSFILDADQLLVALNYYYYNDMKEQQWELLQACEAKLPTLIVDSRSFVKVFNRLTSKPHQEKFVSLLKKSGISIESFFNSDETIFPALFIKHPLGDDLFDLMGEHIIKHIHRLPTLTQFLLSTSSKIQEKILDRLQKKKLQLERAAHVTSVFNALPLAQQKNFLDLLLTSEWGFKNLNYTFRNTISLIDSLQNQDAGFFLKLNNAIGDRLAASIKNIRQLVRFTNLLCRKPALISHMKVVLFSAFSRLIQNEKDLASFFTFKKPEISLHAMIRTRPIAKLEPSLDLFQKENRITFFLKEEGLPNLQLKDINQLASLFSRLNQIPLPEKNLTPDFDGIKHFSSHYFENEENKDADDITLHLFFKLLDFTFFFKKDPMIFENLLSLKPIQRRMDTFLPPLISQLPISTAPNFILSLFDKASPALQKTYLKSLEKNISNTLTSIDNICSFLEKLHPNNHFEFLDRYQKEIMPRVQNGNDLIRVGEKTKCPDILVEKLSQHPGSSLSKIADTFHCLFFLIRYTDLYFSKHLIEELIGARQIAPLLMSSSSPDARFDSPIKKIAQLFSLTKESKRDGIVPKIPQEKQNQILEHVAQSVKSFNDLTQLFQSPPPVAQSADKKCDPEFIKRVLSSLASTLSRIVVEDIDSLIPLFENITGMTAPFKALSNDSDGVLSFKRWLTENNMPPCYMEFFSKIYRFPTLSSQQGSHPFFTRGRKYEKTSSSPKPSGCTCF